MSLEITVSGPAMDILRQQRDAMSSDAVRHAAGRGVRRLIQDYFGGLDSSRPNALGGRRTHFYAQAARGITYDVTPDGAEVAIHQEGIAQRFYGGKIEPVNSRFLTIPVDPEAYGRRAGEFDNLTVQWGVGRSGRARPMFLVRDSGYDFKIGKNRRTGASEVKSATYKSGTIMYYLAISAEQDPDPTVLPDDDLVMQSAVDSISRHLFVKHGARK